GAARAAAPRDLILARTVSPDALAPAASLLNELRLTLLSRGVAARSAAFTSLRPREDIVRFPTEQDVDLLLLDGGPAPIEDPTLLDVLAGAPSDVAVLVGRG